MILKDELLYTVSPSSVQFSCSVLPDFLRPPELQHARPPCPTPNTRVIPNPCPLIQWCHPTTSSSVAPSPPALNFPCIRVFSSESALHIRWLKYWSFSFQWIFVQDWFPLVWDNIHQNFLVLNILFKVKWWVIIDGDFFFNIVSFLRNRHC